MGRHVLDAASAGIPGWRLQVLAPPGKLREALGAKVAVDARFGPGVGFSESWRTLRRVIGELHPRVVHGHLAWADFVTAAVVGRLPMIGGSGGAALVSTEHGIAGDPRLYAAGGFDASATALAHAVRMRRLASLISVSAATFETVRARWHPPDRLAHVVIPNGIDRIVPDGAVGSATYATVAAGDELVGDPMAGAVAMGGGHRVDLSDAETPDARRRPTVGFLGRLSPEKRPELLIAAAARLRQVRPDLLVRIAGVGEQEEHLRTLVSASGLDATVVFDGWVDAEAWLASVDVLCVPSVWENCSYAILQALASGVGVVAAPVGGNPELLPAAALVDPRDSQALADALLRQLYDPFERPRLPDRIPTLAQMTASIAGVYAEVTGATAPPVHPRDGP